MFTAASAYAATNFNPIGMNGGETLSMSATRHVFEGLYDLDMSTYAPYAALAADSPVILSETECEVMLRDDARFSDGADVTADDVVNSFEASLANDTIGPLLSFIDSVAAKNNRTVAIRLKHPFADALEARLSLVKVFPIARRASLDTRPIGSGPWAYAPDGLRGDSSIVFDPNTFYNGPLPAMADRMIWSVMESDGRARVDALRNHSVQVAESLPYESEGDLEHAGVKVDYKQGFCQAFLMFNTLKKPFSDKRVRQAIFYAIDVEKLIKDKLGNHAQPLTGFLPKSHPSYHHAATVYTYNPELAKALLARAGLEEFAFTLLVNNNWVAELAQPIADDLSKVGITCTIKEKSIPWAALADTGRVLSYDVVLASGDPTCFGNDTDLLLSWWYGDNPWTRGRTCWARDPNGSFSIMQDLLQAAREASGTEQQELWNRCFDIIADEVPLYGLFHREIATGWQADIVHGFKPLSTAGLDFLGCTLL